jgi:VIT1/CCC1 family predicted Fe2+/Mn2+ transporter
VTGSRRTDAPLKTEPLQNLKDDLGGYHLVWPRDLVETAGGCLAAGADAEAPRILHFLRAAQEAEDDWAQNLWLDGTPYWPGIQMDEIALPILLVDLAHRTGALPRGELAGCWPMVHRAACFIMNHGSLPERRHRTMRAGWSAGPAGITPLRPTTVDRRPRTDRPQRVRRSTMGHTEHHRIHRSGWLRAAVLGANDGIVSTASLIMGVAAGGAGGSSILLAGTAGLVAGAMSMAAGEYVSVKSQEDTEGADLKLEADALRDNPAGELEELAAIYRDRGLDPELAGEVARQMTAHDALAAHARDEIGITDQLSARPLQAAFWSAGTFSVGAAVPLLTALVAPASALLWWVPILAFVLLGILGALAALAGGAPPLRAACRVCFWGTLAMGLTGVVGRLFGVSL